MRFRRTRPTSHWAAYLEREVSPAEALELQAELARSEQARIQLSQLRRIRELLATFDPTLDQIDLTDSVRQAIVTERLPRRARLRWFLWSAWAAALACLVIAAPTLRPLRSDSNHEFTVKSAAPADAGLARAAVQVYRAHASAPPEPLGFHVLPRDGLLFSYVNPSPQAFAYLMVFAEDASAEIRWYHPAFLAARSDPSSIAVSKQTTPRLLPSVIEHDLAPGPLAIYALFSRKPLRVSTVESWLSSRRRGANVAPLEDAQLVRLDFEVKP